MNERQAVAVLSSYLELLLQRHGLLDESGGVKIDNSDSLPAELQSRLNGLIENAAELKGLIKVGRDARRGKPLSPVVASAAKLMVEEVCRVLAEDYLPPKPGFH